MSLILLLLILWMFFRNQQKNCRIKDLETQQRHYRGITQKYFQRLLEEKRISAEEYNAILQQLEEKNYRDLWPLTPQSAAKTTVASDAVSDLSPHQQAAIKETCATAYTPPKPASTLLTQIRSLFDVLPKVPPVHATTVILSIGVLFIILAGMIFTTTSWQYFSNLVRTGIICSLSLLFFTVSPIAERKLKLPQTSIAFYTLGSAFLPITILAIGYFQFLGDWFSIFGGGKYILGMTASFLMCAASVRGTVKYRSALYLWTALTCLTLGIFCLIKYTTTTNDYLILYFTIYSWAAAWLSHRAARTMRETDEKYMPFIEHCQNFSIMNLGMLTIAAAGAFFLLLLKEAFQTRKFYCVVYPLAVFATLTFAKSFGAVLLFRSGWTPALLAGALILWRALSWARLHFPHRLFLYLHPTLLLVLLYGTNQLLQPARLPENAGLAAAALVSFILYRTYLKARFSSPYADGLFAATALFYSLTGCFHAGSPLYLFAPLAALGIYVLLPAEAS